jgi:hypothetical protein
VHLPFSPEARLLDRWDSGAEDQGRAGGDHLGESHRSGCLRETYVRR